MHPLRRLLLLLAGALLIAALMRHLNLLGHLIQWAELARGMGVWGALLGAALIVLSTLLLLPLNPLIMLAGWVWGYWGILVAIPAAVASATLAFLIARAFGQSAAAQALRGHPKLEHVVAIAERGGALTVALLRVSLLTPFTPGNAILGLTRMPLHQLVVGTLFGMIVPATGFATMGVLIPDAAAIERGDLFPPGRALALGAAGLMLMLGLGALVARKLHRDHQAARPPPP